MLKKSNFKKTINGKSIIISTLSNENGVSLEFMNYGASLIGFHIPNKEGDLTDIVLGYDNIEDYIKDRSFFGATVGRYANRIKNGNFILDGKKIQLAVNNGMNHLHGGMEGLDAVVWDVVEKKNENAIQYSYVSEDGEGNYPGRLRIKVKYILLNTNELKIEYSAVTDKVTIVNLTHHSFFNLRGHGNVLNHEIIINADQFTVIDESLIPTGEYRDVSNSPMDLRQFSFIGGRIADADQQLNYGNGYDHNWILNKDRQGELSFAAKVVERTNGLWLEVWTDQPGMQLYTSNHFDGSICGKYRFSYEKYGAFCLETQHFPDSPNHSHFPSTVLRPGETYRHVCIYKFGVK